MGLMGVVNGELRLKKYKPLFQLKDIKGETSEGTFPSDQGGWWGLSDMYWLGALVPQQDQFFAGLVDKRKLSRGQPLEVRTGVHNVRDVIDKESFTHEEMGEQGRG